MRPMRVIRRAGPWVASVALHLVLGAAAFVTVAGMVGREAATPDPDATYTVAIRPGGGPQIQDPLPSDERSYGVPQDVVTIDDKPLTGVPDLKPASSSKLQASSKKPTPGGSEPPTAFNHGPVVKFGPQGGGGSSTPSPSAGSGTGTETGPGVGEGRDSGVEAVPIETPSPTYPDAARRGNVQGTVIAEIRIDAQGRVEAARAGESSGSGALDDAALAAVRSWRYRPATLNGRPVPSVRRVRFVFRLE